MRNRKICSCICFCMHMYVKYCKKCFTQMFHLLIKIFKIFYVNQIKTCKTSQSEDLFETLHLEDAKKGIRLKILILLTKITNDISLNFNKKTKALEKLPKSSSFV